MLTLMFWSGNFYLEIIFFIPKMLVNVIAMDYNLLTLHTHAEKTFPIIFFVTIFVLFGVIFPSTMLH